MEDDSVSSAMHSTSLDSKEGVVEIDPSVTTIKIEYKRGNYYYYYYYYYYYLKQFRTSDSFIAYINIYTIDLVTINLNATSLLINQPYHIKNHEEDTCPSYPTRLGPQIHIIHILYTSYN
jgi:hypothetical protein